MHKSKTVARVSQLVLAIKFDIFFFFWAAIKFDIE
jgi:hypothetical protein